MALSVDTISMAFWLSLRSTVLDSNRPIIITDPVPHGLLWLVV